MPMILDSTFFEAWLDPRSDPALLKAMMGAAPAGTLDRWPVSRRVNTPRHDDPQCLRSERKAEERPRSKVDQAEFFRLDGEAAK